MRKDKNQDDKSKEHSHCIHKKVFQCMRWTCCVYFAIISFIMILFCLSYSVGSLECCWNEE